MSTINLFKSIIKPDSNIYLLCTPVHIIYRNSLHSLPFSFKMSTINLFKSIIKPVSNIYQLCTPVHIIYRNSLHRA